MCRLASSLALLLWAVLLCSCGSKLPYEGKSSAELERMLKDDDPKVQAQGAYGLSLDRDKARAAVPALIDAMHSPEAAVREKAAGALASAGAGAEDAVPILVEALEDSSWAVQRQSALALGEIGPAAVAAVPALLKVADRPNKPVQEAARGALGKIQR